jgi:hypothetical protein
MVRIGLNPSFHHSTIPVFRVNSIIPMFHYSNIPKTKFDIKVHGLQEVTKL